MTEFEKAVRHALIDRGMTMKDLSEQLEMSTSYLHDIVTDKRKADEQRSKILEFLNINEC